jgi:hypothetical protein
VIGIDQAFPDFFSTMHPVTCKYIALIATNAQHILFTDTNVKRVGDYSRPLCCRMYENRHKHMI